jgi:hypothetical protein
MDEIRINPEEMESGGAREGGRQGLDDTTFDPNASVEQTGDFRQAEFTQHLMADLTKDIVPQQWKMPQEQHLPGPESKSHSKASSNLDQPGNSSHGPGMSGKNNPSTVEARPPESIPGREDTDHAKEAPNPGNIPGYGPGYGGGHKPGIMEAALPHRPDLREVFVDTYKGALKTVVSPVAETPPAGDDKDDSTLAVNDRLTQADA